MTSIYNMKQRHVSLFIRFGPFLLFILLTAFLFGRTLFPPEGQMIYGGDIYDAYFYWKGYLRQSILRGSIPFWNPYNFSGTPFLAHPNINIFYPANWLFILLPQEYSFAWYFFVHIAIAGLSMYILARQFTDRWGAAAAALAYAWGGFFAARIYSGHLEYVDAASWVPLSLALLLRTIRTPTIRNVLAASIGVGVQLLAGNELFFLFTIEIAGLYFVFQSVQYLTRHKIIPIGHSFIALALAVTLAVGLSAVGLLPRLQFIRESIRSVGLPYDVAATGSLPFSGLQLFLLPHAWGNPFPGNYTYHGPWPNFFEYYHYVGIVPVVLLAGSAVSVLCLRIYAAIKRIAHATPLDRFWGRADLWFFLGTICIFLVISLGVYQSFNVHEFLWRYTPLYKGIRFPARHLFVVALFICVLCGMIVGQIRSKWIKAVLIGILAVDLLYTHKPFFRLTNIPTAAIDQKLIKQLQQDNEIHRMLPDFAVVSQVRKDMDFGAAALYKISSTSDYNSMILGRYYRFIDLINTSPESSLRYFNVEIPPPNPNSSGINFLNVKYVLADRSFDLGVRPSDRFGLISEGERYMLFQNTEYLPRFFVVAKARVYTNDDELESALRNDSVDLSSEVAVRFDEAQLMNQTEFPCSTPENSHAYIRSYSANRIIIDVDTTCGGFLSSSEVYYPGWQATVDGKKTSVLLSNYAFRAISIAKGKHTVEYFYRPTIFWIGGVITLMSLCLVGYFWRYKIK